jgi:hemolysin III
MGMNVVARGSESCLAVSSAGEGMHRQRSWGEEVANCVSHGIGLVAAVAAVPVLLLTALRRGEPVAVVGAAVFAVTLLLLYSASTLYHALPAGRSKQICRQLDHQAIFLLIAGTYTPFTLGVLRGPWGWTLLALIWGAAAGGMVLTAVSRGRHPRILLGWYVAMGWLALIAIQPLWQRMPLAGLAWVFGGGLAYTAGLVFYAADQRRYCHCVWHLCVVAGTACHFMAVLWYAAG